MSRAERRASPERRWHVRRSAPVGRISLRPQPKVMPLARRMKPKAWPVEFWFRSALFGRGMASRKQRFAAILNPANRNALRAVEKGEAK